MKYYLAFNNNNNNKGFKTSNAFIDGYKLWGEVKRNLHP